MPGHKYPEGSIRGRWRFRRDELDRYLLKKPRELQKKAVSIWQ
ncbi:MAG: hypothetical protein WCN95_10820 [bacterium]